MILEARFVTTKEDSRLIVTGNFKVEFMQKYLCFRPPYTCSAVDSYMHPKDTPGYASYRVDSRDAALRYVKQLNEIFLDDFRKWEKGDKKTTFEKHGIRFVE
jgi:hypothetical protein